MSPMKSWSCLRIMRSVCERRSAGGRWIDTEALQQVKAAAAAGLQPDLIQPQDVLVSMLIRGLAHFIQCIDHGLELLGQLTEHFAQHAATAARQCFSERGIGPSAHRDVIVDINQLASEALREEPGYEQGNISEALQATIAIFARRSLQRFRQHDHERFEAS